MKQSGQFSLPFLAQLSELSRQIPPQYQLGVISAVVILLTLLVGQTAIQGPWSVQHQQLTSRLTEEKQRSEILQAIQVQIHQRQAQEQALLLEGGAPVLTGQIVRLAKNAGVEIESMTPQPESSYPPYAVAHVQLTTTTNFPNLVNFLYTLESSRPFLFTEEIEVGGIPTNAPTSFPGDPLQEKMRFTQLETALAENRPVRMVIGAYTRSRSKP